MPVLLLHGTQDTNAPFTQSDYLRKQIASVGGNVRLVQLTGNDHYLGTAAIRKTVLTEIDCFLGRYLPI